MKRIISLFSLILLVSGISLKAQNANSSATAQKPPKSAEERTEMWMQKMTERIAITPDQAPKIKDIVLKREKQIAADREKYKSDKEAMKVAMKERNATFEAEIKKVLTAEQFQKLREARRDERAKMKERKQKQGTAAPSDEPIEN
jgi:Spy/CpxP family protein refolding chaperone